MLSVQPGDDRKGWCHGLIFEVYELFLLLLLCVLFLITVLGICLRNPKFGPRAETASWKEKFLSLSGVWSMLALSILVIGGLYYGVFAPTEGGAIGALGAFAIALFRRRMKFRELISALSQTVRLSCMILTLIMGAMIFMSFVTVSGFTAELSTWISALPLPPFAILVFILLIFIPLGMFLDVISSTLLVVPIVAPIISDLGFNLVWFGILIVVLNEMGLVTPPIGMNVFIVQGVTEVPLDVVFRGNLPFIIAMLIGLVLLVAFPEISLFLPSKMR